MDAEQARRKTRVVKAAKHKEQAEMAEKRRAHVEEVTEQLACTMVSALLNEVEEVAANGGNCVSRFWDDNTKYGGWQGKDVLCEAYRRARLRLSSMGYATDSEWSESHDGDTGHRAPLIVRISW